MSAIMSKEQLQEFLQSEFPQVADEFVIEEVRDMALRVRMLISDHHLRPGGTISGPTMFSLADCGIYLNILAMIGPEALTVTTNISMDFMRKPAADKDLIGDCRLLKLGRVLAVGDVLIYSQGDPKPVARASMTYSIPPKRIDTI
ncbi:MAG: PaaI family thioesterase [Thalassovita sp.]